jgi:hypothetical protein
MSFGVIISVFCSPQACVEGLNPVDTAGLCYFPLTLSIIYTMYLVHPEFMVVSHPTLPFVLLFFPRAPLTPITEFLYPIMCRTILL